MPEIPEINSVECSSCGVEVLDGDGQYCEDCAFENPLATAVLLARIKDLERRLDNMLRLGQEFPGFDDPRLKNKGETDV